MQSGIRHPRTTDRVRVFLAKAPLSLLVLEFIAVVVLFSLILAVGFALTADGGDSPSFLEWWKEEALTLLSFPTDQTLGQDAGAGRAILQLTAAVAGVVLPALFVGAIVLKLFISPKLFTMRKKAAVLANDPDDPRLARGGHHLAVRGYSSTGFDLLDIVFSAVIRFERVEGNGTATLLHRPLQVANPHYAVGSTHVPYTLAIPIDDGDWAEGAGGRLATLQGFPIDASADIIVTVKGSIPELSSDFTEAHDFPLATHLSHTPYAGLTVDYGKPSKSWDGWEEFDER